LLKPLPLKYGFVEDGFKLEIWNHVGV